MSATVYIKIIFDKKSTSHKSIALIQKLQIKTQDKILQKLIILKKPYLDVNMKITQIKKEVGQKLTAINI